MRDNVSDIKASRAFSPVAAITANGTSTSQIANRADFDALALLILTGVITDGQWVVTMYESDASDMTGETAVAAADLRGLSGAATLTLADTADNVVRKIGYVGSKQYVRAKAVQSGATSGGFLAMCWLQSEPKVAPLGQS